MKLSTSGLSQQQQQPNEGENKCLNSELWHACAGPLVSLPSVGSRVVYFPQGHSEQVSATTNKEVDAHIPNYPNLPPQLICQLHNVTMHADVETDEVYSQMTLQPLTPQEQKDTYLPVELGIPSKQPTNYFCKTLTASDTSTHGGFSVPRRAAEKVFPPLDFSQQPPAQELIARDLHDVEWKFRHIFRGQPKRHLLTTGWSVFVSAKRLVAGDSVLFIWNEKNQLLLGIRRASRPQTVMPSSVLSSDSMHIGLLAAAAHASATNSCFTIFYNPRASPSEFVIPLSKYVKAVFHTRISVGMRFRMLFETEESSVRRYMGTITGIADLDSVRWPNSHWRSVKVGWDESTAGERQPRVSLWEIEPLTTFPMYPSLFPLRLKRPWYPGGPSSFQDGDAMNGMNWLRGETGNPLLNMNFQSVPGGMFPWAMIQQQQQQHQQQPRIDPALLNPQYQSMLSSGLTNFMSPDSLKQQQFMNQQQYLQQQSSGSSSMNPLLQQQMIHHSIPQILQGQFQHSITGQSQTEEAYLPSLPFPKTEFENSNAKFSPSNADPPPHQFVTHHSPEHCGLGGSQNQNMFTTTTNNDPSTLLLPTTISNINTSLIDADISSVPFNGFQGSLFGNYDQDSSELLHAAVGEAESSNPTCTFIKVYKSGSVGRSLDISRINSYNSLREEVGQMFGIEGLLEDPRRSGWQLVFVDRENEMLLLGDGPWDAFVNNVWYIKILSPEDVHKLAEDETYDENAAATRGGGGGGDDGRGQLSGVPSLGSLEY